MSLAEELVILHKLHKEGGLTDAEYNVVKTQMLRANPQEASNLIKGLNKNSQGTSPLQIGAMAAAGSFAARIVADHLREHRDLKDQIEKLQGNAEIDAVLIVSEDSVNFDESTEMDVDPTF
jgi:hypothetical protein